MEAGQPLPGDVAVSIGPAAAAVKVGGRCCCCRSTRLSTDWSPALTVHPAPQAAVADKNVSETVYLAEALYLRYDIPFIVQSVREALGRADHNLSAINSTHVLFTVRAL